jgi:hypothetical protein
MSKNRCGHRGRIARRQKTGLMNCLKFKCSVTVVVGENQNKCTYDLCKLAKKEIPRVEE